MISKKTNVEKILEERIELLFEFYDFGAEVVKFHEFEITPGNLEGLPNYEFSRTAFLLSKDTEELVEVSFHALIKNGKFQDVYAIYEDGTRFGELPIEKKELLAILVDPTTPLNEPPTLEVNERLSDTKIIEFCKAFIDHTNMLEEEDINEYDLGPLIKMAQNILDHF